MTTPSEPAVDAGPNRGPDGVLPGAVERFDRTTRVVHWCNAALVLTLMLSGAVMYYAELSTLVGNRIVVKYVHIASGVLLPIPLLVGIVGRRGARLRDDLGRLNRWSRPDWRWVRSFGADRRGLGKFNAGQKLNTYVLGAALTVMFVSGLVLWQFEPFSVDTRTAADFTHTSFAFIVWIFVLGHVMKAVSEADAFRSMRHGEISTAWVRRNRPGWYAELEAAAGPGTTPISGVPAPPPRGQSSESAGPRSLP